MRGIVWRLRLLVVAGIASCGSNYSTPTLQSNSFAAGVAVEWMNLSADLVRTERISPPVASRLYAYTAIALFEGVAATPSSLKTLAGQLNELAALPAPPGGSLDAATVANRAAAVVLDGLMRVSAPPTTTTLPFSLASIDGLGKAWSARRAALVPADEHARSVAHGQALGDALVAWAEDDGFDIWHLCPFTPPIGPGLWYPSPPAFLRALEACWGNMRPFVLASADECPALPPTPYAEEPSSRFYAEAREVYDTVNGLTDEQRVIAQFWSDDPGVTATPPGHWVSIVSQVVARDVLPLEVAAEAYARVGLATADAFIACWHTKFQENLVRPVSYIQSLVDHDWLPILGTPPFPEYTSGHSVQSAAASHVLTDLLGHVKFIDETHRARGLPPRFFRSFEEAAEEAAISRLYGGIHFRPAIDNGVAQGRCIGSVIVSRVAFRD